MDVHKNVTQLSMEVATYRLPQREKELQSCLSRVITHGTVHKNQENAREFQRSGGLLPVLQSCGCNMHMAPA